MKRAVITRMASGHWLATIKHDDKVVGTRVVGGPNDKAGTALSHLAKNFGLDQVGVRSRDIGPNTVMAAGNILWMKPGWKG